MRYMRMCVAACVCLIFGGSLLGQQATTPTPQATHLLQQSLAALISNQAISDVTLSGKARRIAGSDDESGTTTYKATSGAYRLDLSLSGGARTEIADLSAASPAASWSGPDGVSHAIAFHNLLSDSMALFPAFAIARPLSVSGYVLTYVGQETREGQSVQHISVYQTASLPNPPGGATYEHLTEVDFFLDSATLLPSAVTFNIHPDNNALVDIPVEVRFSDYRPVHGTQIPFHVQKYLNNTLQLDLQFQAATVNSGLSTATFNASLGNGENR